MCVNLSVYKYLNWSKWGRERAWRGLVRIKIGRPKAGGGPLDLSHPPKKERVLLRPGLSPVAAASRNGLRWSYSNSVEHHNLWGLFTMQGLGTTLWKFRFQKPGVGDLESYILFTSSW